jgi:hypothetical protein
MTIPRVYSHLQATSVHLMSFTAQMIDSLRAARCWIRERDESRGFSINYKRIALAFSIVFV